MIGGKNNSGCEVLHWAYNDSIDGRASYTHLQQLISFKLYMKNASLLELIKKMDSSMYYKIHFTISVLNQKILKYVFF